MKMTRSLVPAIAMLIISAVVMSTASYAWFSMNTNVTATGMSVQAKAEGGIVIANANGGTWAATANAVTANAILYPTSTKDVVTWYHNKSTEADNAAASQAASTYETLTLKNSSTSYGVGYVEDGTPDYQGTEAAYYLLNTFTIKSSSETLNDVTLYINSVTVSTADTATSAELDASLRIAIKIAGDSTTYIYAPVANATATYKVGGSDQTAITVKTTDKNVASSVNTISTTGVGVSVYAYFEGEDASCKSTNASGKTLDNLNVEIVLGTATIA